MSVTRSPSPTTLADVTSAYRLLLGREPDRDGFVLYTQMIESGARSTERMVDIFIGSQEFADRRRRSSGIVELKLNGYWMFVRSDDHDIGAPLLKTKTYEPHVTRMVRELLRVGDTFVDVGANIGYFMALAAHLVGGGRQGRRDRADGQERAVALCHDLAQRIPSCRSAAVRRLGCECFATHGDRWRDFKWSGGIGWCGSTAADGVCAGTTPG